MTPDEIFDEIERLRIELRKNNALSDAYCKVLDSKRATRLEKAHAAVRRIALQKAGIQIARELTLLRATLTTEPSNGPSRYHQSLFSRIEAQP